MDILWIHIYIYQQENKINSKYHIKTYLKAKKRANKTYLSGSLFGEICNIRILKSIDE